MTTKTIGTTNLQTPPIMFGGNVFGWTLDEKESFRMLDMLLERGYTFIDTADTYGKEAGLSEHIIGKWMTDRGVRNKITLATKGGRVHKKNAEGAVEKTIDNRPAYIAQCIKDSLKRLQTDQIDLYYIHFDDESVPVENVLETLQKFMDNDQTKIIGASNFSEERLSRALNAVKTDDLPKYQIFQTEYNLVERKEFENGLGKICADHKVSVATYFSLASGFLTGKYRKEEDFKGTSRKMLTEKYFNQKGKNILKALDEISEEHNISNAGVALAWILNRPNVTTSIASATKESHLDAFDEALNVALTPEEMQRLNKASAY